MKYILVSCLLLVMLNNAYAQAARYVQSDRTHWSNTIGGSGDEEIFDVLETTDGYIVAVGETTSQTKGGKDGLLLINDFYTGNAIQKILLGGKKDDVLTSVIQHWNGTLLLAGHTASKGKYSQDAWLINVDTKGNILWEKTYGSNKPDAFTALEVTKNGQVVTVGTLGTKKGQAWMLLLDEGNLIGEYHLGKGELGQAKDVLVTNNDKIILVGTTNRANGQKAGDAWLLQADLNGRIEWQRSYGENGWEEALSVTNTHDGGYAITGLTKSKGNGEMDMWLIKTTSTGDVFWDRTYGGGDEDIAHDVIQTNDGGFALVGITKSHVAGARRYNMSLVKTDANGQMMWEEHFGGNREDIGNCLLQTRDGGILIGGGTASKGNGAKDAWLTKTVASKGNGEVFTTLGGTTTPTLTLSPVNFINANASDVLNANDRAYLSFDVTNQGEHPLVNVLAEVRPLLQVVGVNFSDEVVIGSLMPQQTKRVSIPISADERLQKGMSTFQINIVADNKNLNSTEANVHSNQVLPPALAFGGSHFNTPTMRSSGSFRAILEVNIQNYGGQSAQNIRGEFIPPDGVKPISNTEFTINYLRPNSTHVAAFDFIVNASANYPDGKIPVKCIIKEEVSNKNVVGTFTLTLDRPTEQTSVTRAPRSSKDLIWMSPNPDVSGSRIISDKEFIDIKIKAVSNNELKADDFTIYLNNTAQDGSKLDPPSLSSPNRKGADFTQTFEDRIQLKLGQNIIEVEVYDDMGNVKTVPIEVTYAPERPNLHILAIGPHHQDLKFTGADARDFANAFANQENKLFDKVFIKSLSDKETTKKDDIQKALLDLQYNYESNAEEAITDNDLLVVFISSHAKRDGRNFLILPSDYSPKYEAIYSLDYERDIIQYLKNINCKKLMFIDACNSGAAYASVSGTKSVTEDGLADAINQINSTISGMSTFTSCRKREKSYEDAKWRNGAFTEVILEALSNQPFADGKGRNYRADENNDGIITLGELKSFLEMRVPYLVKTEKKDAPTTQVPLMTNNELGDQFPFYVIDKSN